MFPEFRHLDGPRAGETLVVDADFVTLGRDPASHLVFDPERDLGVSIRHAAVYKQGGGFMIRDLQSSNGTFVNGERVRSDRALEPGDVVQLGPDGPRIEFRLTVTAPSRSAPVAPPGPALPRRRAPRPTQRFAAPAEPPPVRWRWVVLTLIVAAVGVAAAFGARRARVREQVERDRVRLLAKVDGLLGQLRRAEPGSPLADSLVIRARRGLLDFRRAAADLGSGRAVLDSLGRHFARQAEGTEGALRASAFDPRVADAAAAAVTLVVSRFAVGPGAAGSGVALRTRGDTGWIATSRSVVRSPDGASAVEIALIFNGSGRASLAAIERVHDSADLALLTVRIRGGIPAVAAIDEGAAPGDMVAAVGFPFGIDSIGNWRATGARATTGVGILRRLEDGAWELQAYGTPGSPGTPLFGASGKVVGILSPRSAGGGSVPLVGGSEIRAFLDRSRADPGGAAVGAGHP